MADAVRDDGERGATPLHRAVERLDERAAAGLLANGADPCAVDDAGESPLSVAIRRKHAPLVRLLVDHGALRANAAVRCPFLVHLPELGDLDLLGYVLEKGRGMVSVEDRDAEGRSALHTAVYRGHERMMLLLIRSGFRLSPLFVESARRGDYFWVKGCLDHGTGLIDVNAADVRGNTALHHAVINRDARMARLLLERGADRSLRNADGMTPAMLSAEAGLRELCS